MSCEACGRVEPLHAHAKFRVGELVGVQGLRSLLTHVLGIVEVDFISDLVVNFATEHSSFRIILASEDDMALLGLWMEHDTSDGIVFAFDSHNKLLTFLIVCRQDFKEVSQGLRLSISVRLDSPGVRVKVQILCLHFDEQLVREGFKKGVLAILEIINSEIKRS